ncbi:MAG: N-6 DNA methylase [Pseudomonadota bacterium]
MLDTNTKRRIDSARDILVGKVPDPKSQVEQITIALIYKFMDDMDAEAEEFGGKRKFFTGDFARYGWAKLMSAGIGGHELIGLYGEGISTMPQNPGIPPLFRDIFKNAYLPYRDPETLKSFLKIIDEFSYDHSERLGDAFEYLLSVLGSQGDAGQFRTPRHIIDFIVEVLAPKKGDVILDPACGTAGFLISAYKHILRTNTDTKNISTLTPDEKGNLAKNFKGYDISPDMVRLSLVNLYLHGFTDPHIFEYDSLTSEDRWNEFADVILANPPFMSPKGGIKPHKRFSIQAKRSEVLFVDYIAEHLTPTGRAGIIVPEGIIFQSQTAYKDLRKMLVENSLVAVVSLPAGVFNPYSGVKTSILILDKSLAKQSDSVAFFKVDNDGFGLGAQRRANAGEQLTQVQLELAEYLHLLRSQQPIDNFQPSLGLIVPKEKIAANGDYNLSGERYQTALKGHTSFPMIPLGDVAELLRGITFGRSDQLESASENSLLVATTKASQASGIVENDLYHIPRNLLKDETKLLRSGDILISTANSLNLLGRTTHVPKVEQPMSFGAFMSVIRANDQVLDGYLIHCLRTAYAADFFVRNANTTTNISNLNLSALAKFIIPLPPLDLQKAIVAEIEGYQIIINGARAVLDNYSPHIPIHPDWPLIPIGEACIVNPRKSELNEMDDNTVISFVPMADLNENEMYFEQKDTKKLAEVTSSYTYFRNDDVLLAKVTPCFENGKAGIAKNLVNGIGFGSSEFYVLRSDGRLLPEWIYICIKTQEFRETAIAQMTGTGGLQRVPRAVVEGYTIPIPSLETQQQIIAEIKSEQALVSANSELIARFEKKIQATLTRIWGDDEQYATEVSNG